MGGGGGGGESFPYLTISLIAYVINNTGCCHAALLPSTQKIHYYFDLSIVHKVLCTVLCIFNYNEIFVTALLARNLLYKVQQLVMKY